MSLAAKILAGLLVVGVIAVVLVLLLTGEDEIKGPPLWVVVGNDNGGGFGSIMFSKSGEKWNDSSDKGASFIIEGYGIAYGLGSDKKALWVAVGDNDTFGSGEPAGNILFSTDGKKWTPSNSSGASFRAVGSGVAYGLSSDKTTGLWVAVGNNNTLGGGEPAGNILFSTDGQKWAPSDNSGASFRNSGNGVAYGLSSDKTTGLWVAVGDNSGGACAGNILFSTDGQKWEPSVESGASFRRNGRGVAYGLSSDKKTGLWVAVGNNTYRGGACAGNILFSTDGQKWAPSNISGASFIGLGIGVAYGLDENKKPLWVAVGDNVNGGGAPAGNVLFSRDGQKWTQSDPSGASFLTEGFGAAFGKILNQALI